MCLLQGFQCASQLDCQTAGFYAALIGWGGVQNGKMRYIHHLVEQVMKFKKNTTFAQKSEKLRGPSIFQIFFLTSFCPTPTLIFGEKKFWGKK